MRDDIFLKRQDVESDIFTNTLTFLMSNDIISIYVRRAFQRIYHNPLILQHARKPKVLVRVERFRAIFDIRICHSSYIYISLWRSVNLFGIPNRRLWRAGHFLENMECGAGEWTMDSSFSWLSLSRNESFFKTSEYFYLSEHHFDLAAEQNFQADWAFPGSPCSWARCSSRQVAKFNS